MKRMDDRGSFTLRRRTFLIVGAVVLTAVVAAWVLLIAGVINNKPGKKDSKKNEDTLGQEPGEYQIPKVPEGSVLVFRPAAHYDYDEDGNKNLFSKHEYDENGLLTVTTYFRSDGTKKTKYVYEYDSEGRKTACRGYSWDQEWVEQSEESFEYNDETITKKNTRRADEDGMEINSITVYRKDGHILKSESINDGEVVVSYEEIYSPDGLLQKVYDNGGEFVYFYDSSNRRKTTEYWYMGEMYQEEIFVSARESEEYRYVDGESYLWTRFEYDERGNRIRQINYAADGRVADDDRKEYDDEGNVTKHILYMEGNFLYWLEYEYKGSGNNREGMKETEKDRDGNIIKVTEEEYTQGIYITKRVEYDEAGNETIQVYSEYDEYGNPVKVISRKNDGTEYPTIEYRYIPLAIPEKFATEYDRREK
ncbi:MAG: hypothetical protein IKW95_01475 [Lachnospiraceae bacterium]|nr:hypothetical protein [Lachnospiraceae bacterium]